MTMEYIQTLPNGSLLREAAEWRLIGLLFECPGSGWIEQVSSLASETADPGLKAAADAAVREASSVLYHTTFGPGGPVAPREVSYCDDVLPGGSLAELRNLYEAFAYDPALPEAPDHVAVEAGFVSYLCLKQAYAQTRQDGEQERLCAEIRQQFVDDHLPKMAESLAKAFADSQIEYLTHAAEALLTRVNSRTRGAVRKRVRTSGQGYLSTQRPEGCFAQDTSDPLLEPGKAGEQA